ncbi:uncharacterized protein LOC134239154 [Saccostrea cucullata]|uniref:uncharacterized protein LOC134239154 n=1 Tax=Saccostrea cuccullata TaxID=36930 RepID=UPI002ED2C1AF
MNDAQRNVLQRHFRQLASDLIPTEDFLGMLYQHRIFERNMIEIIKAERTEGDMVYKMLEMLPKRGPDAFDNFLDIIQNDYPWLAATLQSSLKTEMAKSCRIDSHKSDFTDNIRSTSCIDPNEAEPDIKARVSTFVHKQFGQSKRISENDKKSILRWMSVQLQMERKRTVSASSSRTNSSMATPPPMVDEATTTEDLIIDENRISERLFHKRVQQISEKLHQMKKLSNNDFLNGNETDNKNCKDNGKKSTTPSSFDLILAEVDKLVEKVEKMENEINKCHIMLGDREKNMSLSLLIYDLSLSGKNKDKDLQSEKNKSEKMLTELYEYSKKVTKLEQVRHQMKQVIDNQAEEMNKYKAENTRLKDQIIKLEQINMMHVEKQKTLENLRNMVREIQSSQQDLSTASVRSVQTRASLETKSNSSRVPASRRSFRPNQVRPTDDNANPYSTKRAPSNASLSYTSKRNDTSIPYSSKKYSNARSSAVPRKGNGGPFK